jgi:hypothetical protein
VSSKETKNEGQANQNVKHAEREEPKLLSFSLSDPTSKKKIVGSLSIAERTQKLYKT